MGDQQALRNHDPAEAQNHVNLKHAEELVAPLYERMISNIGYQNSDLRYPISDILHPSLQPIRRPARPGNRQLAGEQ